MKEELSQKLYDNFPLLYRDRNESLRNSLMRFGFDCGDGWFQLLWDLSLQLEKEIYLLDIINRYDCTCGCPEDMHISTGCQEVHRNPFFVWRTWHSIEVPQRKRYKDSWSFWKAQLKYLYTLKVKWKAANLTNTLFEWLRDRGLLYKSVKCSCEKYAADHPRAFQVKEKFGGLRFYMTGIDSADPEIARLIAEAEKKSNKICEECGAPGTQNPHRGWCETLCEIHSS